MNTPSALPAAMQQRMQALQAVDPPTQDPPTLPPTQDPPTVPPTQDPPAAPPATNTEGEKITLSREEYNELRANAGRSQALAGREEIARLESEELRQRLTELENSNKPSSTVTPPAAPPAPVDVSGIIFSSEEDEQFGDSRGYIEKVVDLRIAEKLNTLLPGLNAAIKEAKEAATGAVGEVTKTNQRTFHQQLIKEVPELQNIIQHKNWEAFLDETDAISGFTYEQLLANNVGKQKLESTARIYKMFEDKYVKPVGSTAGYQGANPSGSAAQLPPEPGTVEKLKLSGRQKASEDYRKGRISWEDLQVVQKKYEEADKLGNVDHTS